MTKRNLLILLGSILAIIYTFPVLYSVINYGIEEVPLTMFLTTLVLIALPLKIVLIGCLLPPVWIFLTWYLFVKKAK